MLASSCTTTCCRQVRPRRFPTHAAWQLVSTQCGFACAAAGWLMSDIVTVEHHNIPSCHASMSPQPSAATVLRSHCTHPCVCVTPTQPAPAPLPLRRAAILDRMRVVPLIVTQRSVTSFGQSLRRGCSAPALWTRPPASPRSTTSAPAGPCSSPAAKTKLSHVRNCSPCLLINVLSSLLHVDAVPPGSHTST